jgi:two-component system NtrC family sensor kinase
MEKSKLVNVAIVGGGTGSKAIMDIILDKKLSQLPLNLIGVADPNPEAVGYRYAKEKGIFTTGDYKALYTLKNLNMLIELTGREEVANEISRNKPERIHLIDHLAARLFLDIFQIEEQRIVELTRAEAALQETGDVLSRMESLSQIVQATSIPTFVIDSTHTVTHWNKACENLTGIPGKEIIGTQNQWLGFYTRKRPVMADLMVDNAPEEEILRYYGDKGRKSGVIEGAYEAEDFFPDLGERGKWVFFTAAPLRDREGKVTGAIETLQDISERKRAEEELKKYRDYLEVKVKDATEELREAHDFQENLIESSIDAIIGIDREGTILIFNKAAERLIGYRSEHVIGHKHITQIYYPPEVASEIKKKMYGLDYGVPGRVEDLEVEVLSKNGDIVPIRLSATLLYKEGEEIGSVGFFQDLRKIKGLEKELIERERLSAIGQTIAGMGHYIKNILNGLEGGIYMVNSGLKKDKQPLLTKGWGIVQNNVAKISDLVLDMLTYSREREPELESCSPNDIAQDVFDLMEEKAKSSNVTLVKDFDSSIEVCFIDPAGIHRCLLNLVTNAIDACVFDENKEKEWSVVIKTRTEEDGIRLDVTDNGMGMTEEVKRKIFERFFTTKGSKGSGFGLLVTQKTIEEHGGRVSFESDPGKGTIFSLHLPYIREI